MFNPMVSHFRIHFFSARPCFNFATAASLTDFAKSFMSTEKYYQSDPEPPQPSPPPQGNGQGGAPQITYSVHRLGRRCQYDRQSSTRARAHKFWSAYMNKVAHEDYRGPWRGLAPLRAEFKDTPQRRLLRLKQDSIQQRIHAQSAPLKITSFPKLHLCPIGWAAGIVVDVEGDLPFDQLSALVDLLRSEPAYLFRNEKDPLQLDQLLTAMHRLVRDALLVTDRRRPVNETARSYIVCSPLAFQGQTNFAGDEQIDLSLVLRVLEQNPSLSDDSRRTVSPTPRSFTVTRFNRGTMRITATRSDDDHQSPACALSNLKNCLLMTSLMEQFHSDAAGHSSPAVQQMREEVELTFALLKSAWKSPHFHALCNRDSGLQKMMRSAVTNVYNFIQSNFQGVAIGDNAKVIGSLDPARRAVYLSAQDKMEEMAKAAGQGKD
jgi:hypothetical protein